MIADLAKADCVMSAWMWRGHLYRRHSLAFCTLYARRIASHRIVSHLKLVDVTSIRSGHCRTTGRRTRVRVNDVHSEAHVARISTLSTARSPREAHRGLAAAVMKKLDVSAAKVAVRYAVEQIVEARLGQGEPGQVVKHTGADRNEGIHADRQAERQPERDEYHTAVHIRLRELVVPGKGGRRLVRDARGPSHTYQQLHVKEDRRQSWQPNQYACPHHLFHRDTAELATAKIRTYIQGRLQSHHSYGD